MRDVLRLGQSQFLVGVDQHDLVADTQKRHRVGGRTSHHTGSDDPDFHD